MRYVQSQRRIRDVRWIIAVGLLAMTAGGCGSGGSAADDLVGTWEDGSGFTMVINADSTQSGVLNGETIAEGTYTATDSVIELTDAGGPRACAPNEVGIYEWQIQDDVLSLTLVDDQCGRQGFLDGISLERAG